MIIFENFDLLILYSYELQKFSGKVLIVRNQVYHKVHIEESKRDKDCGTCDKDTRAVEALEFVESIEKEDEKVENLVKKFKELGFKDIYGGTESFVQKDKTKKEIIKLLEEGKLIYMYKSIYRGSRFFHDYIFIRESKVVLLLASSYIRI